MNTSVTIWNSPSPDHLFCQQDIGNPHDTYTVAIKGNVAGDGTVTTLGHVPRKISALCSIFVRHGGTIVCIINDAHCYSVDLPQSGLEIHTYFVS